MLNETLTFRQAIYLMIMFIFGSSIVMGVSTEIKQDAWISLLLSLVIVIPNVIIYARILKLFPQMDIFDITQQLFGKIISKIIIVLFSSYALHLASIVLRNFSEFIEIVAMPETPQLPIMLVMVLVTAYMAKVGVEALGKWAVFTFFIVVTVVILTVIFSVNVMEFTNIMPIANHKFSDIAKSAFSLFTFPFVETVLFMAILNSIKKTDSPYKIYIFSILISTMILLLVILRNLFVLGVPMTMSHYFPSFVTARIINIGDFISRIESSISLNLILTGITKITVCLLVATKGFSKLFNIPNYRKLLMPITLLVLALCPIIYKNTMEMFDFIKVYQYYSMPFQIVIPLLIWITAEIKVRKNKSANKDQIKI